MLTFVLNAQDQSKKKEVSWKVGEKVKIESTDIMDVDTVKADGDELKFVKQVCPSLSVAKTDVVTFEGSDAMEVAAMLLAKA